MQVTSRYFRFRRTPKRTAKCKRDGPCTSVSHLLHIRYTSVAHPSHTRTHPFHVPFHIRCTSVAHPLHIRFTSVAHPFHMRYTPGTHPVHYPFHRYTSATHRLHTRHIRFISVVRRTWCPMLRRSAHINETLRSRSPLPAREVRNLGHAGCLASHGSCVLHHLYGEHPPYGPVVLRSSARRSVTKPEAMYGKACG